VSTAITEDDKETQECYGQAKDKEWKEYSYQPELYFQYYSTMEDDVYYLPMVPLTDYELKVILQNAHLLIKD